MKDLIVGTAGHIDHGKTALVLALTGIDTDRLIEEKSRGITIDIGFAHLELGEYRIGFIDVPGHEKYVKNMLAGIGGIKLLLLVISADESVMPQTVEHYQICRLLNIRRGVIVITKKDQVDQELLSLVHEEVKEFVENTFLEGAPICSVDSISGEGIPELKQTLRNQIEEMDQRNELEPRVSQIFRLPVDRVFSVRGFGTVVTGTLLGGELQQNQSVALYPEGGVGKVRGVEIFNQKTARAQAGQRTALNLSGFQRSGVQRGMILSVPDPLQPSQKFDTVIQLLTTAPKPLRNRSPIRFHHGSGELIGRVYLLQQRVLEPGQEALIQIRLEKPTLCFPGDRFVLRRYSPLTTVGGGIILDNDPPLHRKKDREQHISLLEDLQSAMFAEEEIRSRVLVETFVERCGILGSDLKRLVSLSGLDQATLLKVLDELDSVYVVPQEPPLAVGKKAVACLRRDLGNYLENFHRGYPLAAGVSREELKERFLDTASNTYFQFLLATFEKEQLIEIRESKIALKGATVRLSPEQAEIREKIFGLLEESPWSPPTLSEIAGRLPRTKKEIRDVFYHLLVFGELVRVSEDMVLLPQQLESLEKHLRTRFPAGSRFSVAEFKELFGISRKYAIPLLELLDRRKVTRRVGDTRIVI
jgi:selenocysteine-specific elongation factor